MSNILIYSGRFQPFGPHHFSSYNHLKSKFPNCEIYIATSNKTEEGRSPLNFEQKKNIIKQYGIPDKYIVQVKNPYSCIEITSKYELDSTRCVFALGEKDSNRIHYDKKDGSESFFKKYSPTEALQTILNCAYVYTIPNQYNSTELLSSSKLRNILPNTNEEQFKKIMGFYNKEIHGYFNKNLTENTFQKNTSNNKSIKYLYSNYDLTFKELFQIITDICTNTITSFEKVDGQSVNFTYKNGSLLIVRNKEQFKNPIRYYQLYSLGKNADFVNSVGQCINLLNLNLSLAQKLFLEKNKLFLNCEILDPQRTNVINYGDFKLVIHSLITVDDEGNIINFNSDIDSTPIRNVISENIILDSVIKFDYDKIKGDLQELKFLFNKILSECNLTDENTILDYYKSLSKYIPDNAFPIDVPREKIIERMLGIMNDMSNEFKKYPGLLKDITQYKEKNWEINNKLYLVEDLINEFISYVFSTLKIPERNLKEIQKRIIDTIQIDDEHIRKNYKRLINISSIENIIAFEGIVFYYNNTIYKLTGSYQYINQILAKEKYGNKIN